MEDHDVRNEQPAAADRPFPYRPGDTIEIEVAGYGEPFRFAVKLGEFQRLQRAGKKEMAAALANFIRASSLEWERLGPLLDEASAEFDISLQALLANALMEALGLDREATVKKR